MIPPPAETEPVFRLRQGREAGEAAQTKAARPTGSGPPDRSRDRLLLVAAHIMLRLAALLLLAILLARLAALLLLAILPAGLVVLLLLTVLTALLLTAGAAEVALGPALPAHAATIARAALA